MDTQKRRGGVIEKTKKKSKEEKEEEKKERRKEEERGRIMPYETLEGSIFTSISMSSAGGASPGLKKDYLLPPSPSVEFSEVFSMREEKETRIN
eukprot:PDM63007.1 hypothetical protein PRIPAC_50222 [Pristionchus pacificus]